VSLIILLIKNNTDRKLLADFLRLSKYSVEESIPDSIEIQQKISLILTEAPAPAEMEKLFLFKHQSAMNFLPIVVILPSKSDSAPWLDAGFNDVLRMPLVKNELLLRLQSLLKIHEEANSEYKFIFKNINSGIYKMSLDKKITMANKAFIQILGLHNFDYVHHKTLNELGIITSQARDELINKINITDSSLTYESIWKVNDESFYILENIELIKYKSLSFYLCTLEDFTERKKIKDTLEESEGRYRQLVDQSPYGILIIDEYRIEFINPSFLRMLHALHLPQILHRNFLEILHPEFLNIVKYAITSALNGNDTDDKIPVKLIATDYAIIDVEISPVIINYKGKPAIQLTVNDLTETLKTKKIIRHMTFHDPLTNLPNRMQLEVEVKNKIHKAEQNSEKVYILLLNLDNFKNINDNFGRQIGDAILIEMGVSF
jgi:PAS domain S-box-containing protein